MICTVGLITFYEMIQQKIIENPEGQCFHSFFFSVCVCVYVCMCVENKLKIQKIKKSKNQKIKKSTIKKGTVSLLSSAPVMYMSLDSVSVPLIVTSVVPHTITRN